MLILDEEKEKLKILSESFDAVLDTLDTGNLTCENEELLQESENLNIYYDIKKLKKVNKRLKYISNKLESFKDISLQISEMQELLTLMEKEHDENIKIHLNQELNKLEKDLNTLIIYNFFTEKYDINASIIKVTSSVTSIDNYEFVKMLYNMYEGFAEKMGYEIEVLEYKEEEGGFRNIQFLVDGDFAFGHLKGENGIHKLSRISPYDSNKKRSPVSATVEVMYVIEEDNEIQLNENQLKIDTFKSSGAGGQHVNTTDSAVRITHLPTDIVVTCQNERSQSQNLKTAKKVLLSRLMHLNKMQTDNCEIKEHLKDEINANTHIRTYSFHPTEMVTDVRTNTKIKDLNSVLQGNLLDIIYAYLKWLKS